jgi:putative DNA primase/helicase
MTATAAKDPFANLDDDLRARLAGMADPEQGAEPWPEPAELPGLLPAVPEMPAALIPEPFRGFVMDVSERMQVAAEIPAVSIIVSISSVVGRSIGIHPKQHDPWLVIPNLWGLIAARSGMLKSPAIAEGTGPIGVLERNERLKHESEEAALRADEEISAARLAAVRADIAKAAKSKNEAELRQLKDELLRLQAEIQSQRVPRRRYRANDATTEKLLEILVDNPRGLFVYRDELAGWLRSLDKVGREMDRAFYLESWNGDQPFTSDRIGRGTIHVPALCLSVFGGIQPPKLAAYVSDTLNSTSNDDGLIQRFQLAVHPDPHKDWKLVDRPADHNAKGRAVRVFEILDAYEPGELGVPVEHGTPSIHFDAAAQDLFNEWVTTHQRRILEGECGPAFESHLSKYRSLMPSLALLFHLIEWADANGPRGDIGPVSLDAAALAAAWCDYLELHARKIYAGAINPDLQAAHLLQEKIRQGKVRDGSRVREIYRNQWSGLQTKERVIQGLMILAEHGHVRLASVKAGAGRPASETVNINPRLKGSGDGF